MLMDLETASWYLSHGLHHGLRQRPAVPDAGEVLLPPAPSMTDGLLVLVQLVMAAMTTEPWLREYSSPLNWKGTAAPWRSGAIWKPLKPCW
ncbi:hypothetical protein EYF80_043175 [Liparis tanakae]|uniref:Uncharacterized protein n=1 Tax=Liparis tanakae TaxID=230148 RepID=A0A4Z2G279_9TELE|nr:hypothetical protein EYF80_043175 [Liparis tanakae]